MKLYDELSDWWQLMSPPDEYREEASHYTALLKDLVAPKELRTLLELGSGGGHNASHMKAHFDLTLVDLSPGMLAVSRALNPNCDHHVGDMRSIRLGRTFDAVFIHDAICYLTTEADLRRGLTTAAIHLDPGGVALFAPDYIRETFHPGTDDGGHDGDGRSMRWLEWVHDPDPSDTTYTADYAYMLLDESGMRVVHDSHVEGLFPRATWLRLCAEAGFASAEAKPFALDDHVGEIFLAIR